MSKPIAILASAGAATLALVSVLAWAHDGPDAKEYPTVERVQFVEACVRDHPERQRTEMLYKCSCAMDAFVERMHYDDYVESSTAFFGSQVAGPRGAEVREGSSREGLAERYRDTRAFAFKRCMIE